MRFEVELSGEAPALARAELEAVAASLGGSVVGGNDDPPAGEVAPVDLPDRAAARQLVGRLALARRCYEPLVPGDGAPGWLRAHGNSGARAAFRRRAHPTGAPNDSLVAELATAWVSGGGSIDLEHPERRFWIDDRGQEAPTLLEEVGATDRPAMAARRISRLPFRRPVGLDPRLARAAANLAGAGPGIAVADPFVGTGALLAEAALLGARVTGVDLDAAMVRGAALNLEHVGRSAERLVCGDAEEVAGEIAGRPFDAVLTDAPYGRSSGTGGEGVESLLARVLPAWAGRVRPGGRIVLVCAGGPDPLGPPWKRIVSVPVRQHRSLTREFRVYRDVSPVPVTGCSRRT